MVTVLYAPGTLNVVAVCDGPDRTGFCPRITLADEVPCSGLEIVLSKDDSSPACGLVRSRIAVAPRATACPLARRLPGPGV